mgnify:CR=1 FL=1
MGENGLQQVENPSQAMLSGRPKDVSGTCVTAVMEGTRPILAEIQGLATTSGYGNPRRMATGFDYNRMALLLAVLCVLPVGAVAEGCTQETNVTTILFTHDLHSHFLPQSGR